MLSVLPELAQLKGRLVGEFVCIMTPSASQMIHPTLVGSVLGTTAYSNWSDYRGSSAAHKDLVRDVDAILIAPATANTLAGLAWGMTGNLLKAAVANFSGPVGLVPSVNDVMGQKRATQRVLAQLASDGYLFAEEEGRAAVDLEGNVQIGASRFGLRRLLIRLADAREGGTNGG